jgi:hypothetical protein
MNANVKEQLRTHTNRRYAWQLLPRAISYIAIYAFTIALTSLLWQRPLLLTLAYVLLSSLLLWRWHAFADVLYFTLPAILGPLGEIVPITFGAWEYALPILKIPLWLPLAWGISGLCMKKIADMLMEVKAGEAY